MIASERAFDIGSEEPDEPRVLWPMIALFWVVNIGLTTVQVYVNARPRGVSRPHGDPQPPVSMSEEDKWTKLIALARTALGRL